MDTPSLIEPLEARIAPAALAIFDLSALHGPNGFKIQGENTDTGGPVSGAGDINGDGFDDLLLGASTAEPNGAAYVVFGKAQGFGKPVNLSSLDGAAGFKIQGEEASQSFGSSLSGAGDVNGDGFDDFVIGAHYADPNFANSGASYVIFGKAGGFRAPLDLSRLNGANGFTIQGEASNDTSGRSVSGAGDVNGDGLADLLIGADGADPNGTFSGAGYVIFGRTEGFSSPLALSSLTGANGFKIQGEAAGDFAGVMSAAGDVNGDGFDDIFIGAYGADPNGASSGASYVIFGKGDVFNTPLNLSSLTGANGFKIQGEAAGDSLGTSIGDGGKVSGAGDINGDGFADLLIGAPFADPNGSNSGASYVVFGKAGAFSTPLNLSSLSGADGFKIQGEAANHRSGSAVSPAGDVNGDGFGDLFIGSPSGAGYVVFGKAGGFETPLDLSTLNGVNGMKIQGGAVNGRALSAAGDFNGDGFGDLVLGAATAGSNGTLNDAGYVVFGSAAFGTAVSFSKDHKTATFTDQNTCLVTVKITKGQLASSNFHFADNGALERLDLTALQLVHNGGGSFQGPTVLNGSGLSITAKSVGFSIPVEVAMGAIDAHGLDLGAVTVAGTIEQIDAGDANIRTTGIQSLTVNNFAAGAAVVQYQPAGTAEPYHSVIVGALGSLSVKADLNYAVIDVTGGAFGKIGKVTIGNALIGRDLPGSELALIRATGNIGPVSVKLGIFGGDGLTGIIAGGTLGAVSVGALASDDLAHPVILSALGKLGATKAAATVAIASITVKDSVSATRILAGYTPGGDALNPDASIGAIKVGRDWTASSVVAGVKDATGDGFGRNDALIGGDTTATLFATIASITIKGVTLGSAMAGDHFGLTAQRMGKISTSVHSTVSVPPGANTPLDSVNNDFRLVTL